MKKLAEKIDPCSSPKSGLLIDNEEISFAVNELAAKIAAKTNCEVVMICREFSNGRWLFSNKDYVTSTFIDMEFQKKIKGKVGTFRYDRDRNKEMFDRFTWSNKYKNIHAIQHFPIVNADNRNMGHLVLLETNKTLTKDSGKIKEELNALGDLLTVKFDNNEWSHYQNIFMISTDMICVVGTDGFFKSINPAFRRTLQWGEKDLLENRISDLIHPDDIKIVESEFRKIDQGKKSINFQLRFRTKNNEYKLLEWVVSADLVNKLFYAIGRDITQFEETKYELIQAKEMLEETNRVAQIGGWELDVVTNNLYWTLITKEIHDLDNDAEVEFDEAINFYKEGGNRFKISNLIYKAITKFESFDTELQILTKKGIEKWVRVIGKPKIDNGTCVKVTGTFQDIEHDKQVRLALEQSNTHLEAILNASTETSIIATKADGTITHFNSGSERLLGYSANEIVGKHDPVFFFDKIDLERWSDELTNEFGIKVNAGIESFTMRSRRGLSDKGEYTYIRKDGRKIMVELSISPITNNKEDILGYLCIADDITEKKRVEQLILDSEERLRIFFDSSQVVMYTHDMAGNFITINSMGAHLLGYNREDIENKNIMDIIPLESRLSFPHYLNDLKTNGKSKGLMQIINNQGKLITWMYNNVVTELVDGTKYVIGNVMDITDRIELENDLNIAKQNAENSAKMKDLFLSNMSHEIRTPMNAITGFGRLLSETTLDEEQDEYVNSINIASTNLLNIINDILDFSKIESGQISIESIPFNIIKQIQNVRKILTINAETRNLQFKYDFDEKLPEMVMGDPTRLNQILVNLLNNGIKFTESGFVKLKVEFLQDSNDCYNIKFDIIDSGIGIPEDKIDVIFERFTQANTNTTRKYGGTGLGLSISKSLVGLLGGTLTVESTEGEGSIFSFTIPFGKPIQEISQETAPSRIINGKSNIRILLVEDNLLNQKLARKVLEKQGFISELAENGKLAIELLKKESFDLILMDLQMPEMDGYQTTIYLRNEMKLKTPIIAMTAHSIVGEKDKCLSIGMNDYIPKPFNPDVLYEKIMHYTKKRRNMKIDLTYLKSIAEGNKEFEKEIIDTSLTSIPMDMEALMSAIRLLDLVGIKEKAHKLKSSFYVIGIDHENILNQLEYDNISDLSTLEDLYVRLENIQKETQENLEMELVENYS